VSREELFAEHSAFGTVHNRTAKPAFTGAHNTARAKRLRVGFVSVTSVSRHAVFRAAGLQARPHDAFEIFCYSNTARTDEHTSEFRAAADHWRDVRGLSNDALTGLIVRDQIDVLIDLSGHTPNNRLLVFAAKPAPLQIAWATM